MTRIINKKNYSYKKLLSQLYKLKKSKNKRRTKIAFFCLFSHLTQFFKNIRKCIKFFRINDFIQMRTILIKFSFLKSK